MHQLQYYEPLPASRWLPQIYISYITTNPEIPTIQSQKHFHIILIQDICLTNLAFIYKYIHFRYVKTKTNLSILRTKEQNASIFLHALIFQPHTASKMTQRRRKRYKTKTPDSESGAQAIDLGTNKKTTNFGIVKKLLLFVSSSPSKKPNQFPL